MGVQRVADFLRVSGAEARLEQFKRPTHTAEDAARALGCSAGEIVKSLVFLCDGRPLVVLVPGDRRADVRKVARAAGCADASVVGREEVPRLTGFEAGAVAPFPLPVGTEVLVERALLALPLVWIGAGSASHLAAIAPGELVRLARARPIDAVQKAGPRSG